MINSLDTAAAYFNARSARSRTYVDGVKAVRISNNTTVRAALDGSYRVRYHDTDVVTYLANGDMILAHGGWATVWTTERIHKHTPPHIIANGKDILSKRADARPRIMITDTRTGLVAGLENNRSGTVYVAA